MDFEYSAKTKGLLKRVDAFMDEWVYPNEHKFYEEVGTGDRWQPTKIIDLSRSKPVRQAYGICSCQKANSAPD